MSDSTRPSHFFLLSHWSLALSLHSQVSRRKRRRFVKSHVQPSPLNHTDFQAKSFQDACKLSESSDSRCHSPISESHPSGHSDSPTPSSVPISAGLELLAGGCADSVAVAVGWDVTWRGNKMPKMSQWKQTTVIQKWQFSQGS